MTKISFKYDPYTKEKEFLEDGVLTNRFDGIFSDKKELMEFENFFRNLSDELGDDFELSFTGIQRDYDFLEDNLKKFKAEEDTVKIRLLKEYISASNGNLKQLKDLFERMQCEAPYKELKSDKIKKLFEKALSNEFEMAVIATMSSGKSTLINSMLGKELLPSGNKATTARIAKIHNFDNMDHFKCLAFDKDDAQLAEYDPLTLENMVELNSNENVSAIEISGNIVGIPSNELELVLTDTPGPNNSATQEHRDHTNRVLAADYKPMVLYVLNATQLETDDDAKTLDTVAKYMLEGGRQSKDRFLFVLNRADDSHSEEELISMIETSKVYLEKHKIQNPRIFPCSALLAKVIRQYQAGEPLTESEEDEILPKVDTYVKREYRHFSDKAPLTNTEREKLNRMLEKAKADDDKYTQALIYTGVPAIEIAITEYLEKYAVPTKIREAVDSFNNKIRDFALLEKSNREISSNKDKLEELTKQISSLQLVLKKGDKAKNLKSKISGLNIDKQWKQASKAATAQISLDVGAIEEDLIKSIEYDDLGKYAKKIGDRISCSISAFKVNIENAVNDVVKKQATDYVEEYENYLKGLVGDSFGVNVKPANLFGGEAGITVEELLSDVDDYTEERVIGTHEEEVGSHQVKVGTHKEAIGSHKELIGTHREYVKTVRHENKGFRAGVARLFKKDSFMGGAAYWTENIYKEVSDYKTVTDYKDVDDYKTVKDYKTVQDYGTFVDFEAFYNNKIKGKLEDFISATGNKGLTKTRELTENLKKEFLDVFDELEIKIQGILADKQDKLKDKNRLEELVKQSEQNLAWLSQFKKDLESVLSL